MVYHLCAKFERLQGTKKTVGIVVGVAGDICKSDRSLMVTWTTLREISPFRPLLYTLRIASSLMPGIVDNSSA